MDYAGAYTTSKTALIRLTESTAKEAAEHGVRVFAISPGLVKTAMPSALVTSEAGKKWIPRFAAGALDNAIPPERAAQLCVTLASGAADALSGRMLGVQDDIEVLAGAAEAITAGDLYVLRMNTLPVAAK